MSKIRIKDLTLGQIIEIAETYNKSCGRCPLFNTPLHCFNFCDASEKKKKELKDMVKGFMNLEENSIIKEETE